MSVVLSLLAVLAIAAAGIVVWKLIDLSITTARTAKLLGQVDALLDDRKLAEALAASRGSDVAAGRILAAGLSRRGTGTDRVIRSFDNAGLIELARLERGVPELAALARIAPLLGFLGTVLALGALGDTDAAETPAQIELATAARSALWPAAVGLLIAIPAATLHAYFSARVVRLVREIERSIQKAIDALDETESSEPR